MEIRRNPVSEEQDRQRFKDELAQRLSFAFFKENKVKRDSSGRFAKRAALGARVSNREDREHKAVLERRKRSVEKYKSDWKRYKVDLAKYEKDLKAWQKKANAWQMEQNLIYGPIEKVADDAWQARYDAANAVRNAPIDAEIAAIKSQYPIANNRPRHLNDRLIDLNRAKQAPNPNFTEPRPVHPPRPEYNVSPPMRPYEPAKNVDIKAYETVNGGEFIGGEFKKTKKRKDGTIASVGGSKASTCRALAEEKQAAISRLRRADTKVGRDVANETIRQINVDIGKNC